MSAACPLLQTQVHFIAFYKYIRLIQDRLRSHMDVKKRYIKAFKDQWNQVVNSLLKQELGSKEKQITKLISNISEDFVNSVATAFFDQEMIPRLETMNSLFSLTNPGGKRFRLDYIRLTIENKKNMWIFYAVKRIKQERLEEAERAESERLAAEQRQLVEASMKEAAGSEGAKGKSEGGKRSQGRVGKGSVDRKQESLFNARKKVGKEVGKGGAEKERKEKEEERKERLRQQTVVESMRDQLPKFKKCKLVCTVTRDDIQILVQVLENYFSNKV